MGQQTITLSSHEVNEKGKWGKMKLHWSWRSVDSCNASSPSRVLYPPPFPFLVASCMQRIVESLSSTLVYYDCFWFVLIFSYSNSLGRAPIGRGLQFISNVQTVSNSNFDKLLRSFYFTNPHENSNLDYSLLVGHELLLSLNIAHYNH